MCCVTNPIWVIKTRLQLQRGTAPKLAHAALPVRSNAAPYTGLVHAVKQIAKEEGFRGFYKGLLPSLLLVQTLQWWQLHLLLVQIYCKILLLHPLEGCEICPPCCLPAQHDLLCNTVFTAYCCMLLSEVQHSDNGCAEFVLHLGLVHGTLAWFISHRQLREATSELLALLSG